MSLFFRSDESDNDVEHTEAHKEDSDVEESQKDSESQTSETRSRYKTPKRSLETKRPGKKPVAIKNVTDIEALELATEQTLKVSFNLLVLFTLLNVQTCKSSFSFEI